MMPVWADALRSKLLRNRLAISIKLLTLVAALAVMPVSLKAGGLPAVLLARLDGRFTTANICHDRDVAGLIVLGGGEQRLIVAGDLARSLPHAQIVVTGAGPEGRIRQLLGSGIASDRIVIEPNARTTYENAVYTAALVRRQPVDRWVLITSATHMPRAIGAFYRAGFKVEPWPVHDIDANSPDAPLVAWHEWLGLAKYWVLGRSQGFFPGPATIDGARAMTNGSQANCNDDAGTLAAQSRTARPPVFNARQG